MKNLKNIFPFKYSEWICFIFLFFSLLHIFLSKQSLNWSAVKLAYFPCVDLLTITLALWLFKTTETMRTLRYIGFSLLILIALKLPDQTQIPFIFMWVCLVFIFFFRIEPKTIWIKIDQLRIIIPLFIMLYLYPVIPLIQKNIHSVGYSDKDKLLLAFDQFLFGGINPHLYFEPFFSSFFYEFMAFAYIFYILLLIIVIAYVVIFKSVSETEKTIFMLCLCLAVGYLGYLEVPAIGPLYTLKFKNEIGLKVMNYLKVEFYDKTRIDRDCFPSLHTGITLILCYQIFKLGNKTIQIILLPFAILIPLSCIVLRYHYFIDVIFGAILALLVILFANYVYEDKY